MTAGDVYRALWRHKFVIVVLTAVCVGATWFATSRQTPIYKASTLVRVQQRGAANSFTSLDASVAVAQTYAEIIDSGALDEQARSLARRRITAGQVADVTLSAEPVPDLALIWISARSRHRAGAATAANSSPQALRSAVRQLGTPGDQIVTIKRAGIPSSPVSPDTTLNVVLALVLGLMFNGGLALLFEVLRDRLPDPDDLETTLGYPVLATIPMLRLKPIAAVADTTADRGSLDRDPLPRSGTPVSRSSAGDGDR